MLHNLFQAIAPDSATEQFEDLLNVPGLRVERIVSAGQASPPGFWYQQEWDEWVVVLRGRAQLRLEDKVLSLGPGDHCWLPAGCRHRVDATTPDEPTVWLAVHRGCEGTGESP
ncbi:MAG: cupin domain-containing protein [Burkholderiaceae bacterium]